jgi:sulfur carrier protein
LNSEPPTAKDACAKAGTVVANGKCEPVNFPCSLAQFLQAHQLDPRQVAVERNGEIVFKSDYSTSMLQDGDRLEIIKVVAGG